MLDSKEGANVGMSNDNDYRLSEGLTRSVQRLVDKEKLVSHASQYKPDENLSFQDSLLKILAVTAFKVWFLHQIIYIEL